MAITARLISDDSPLEMHCQKVKLSNDKQGHRVCELTFAMALDTTISGVLPDWISRQFLELRKPGGPSTSSWKDREMGGQVVTFYSAQKPHDEQFELKDVTILGIYLERDQKTGAIHLFFSVKVICGKGLWDWVWHTIGGFVRASIVPAQAELVMTKVKNRRVN